MVISSKYKNRDEYRFPNKDINPEKKGKNYCRKTAEAIVGTHLRGRSGIPYDELSEWDDNVAYADGKQSSSQYMDYLLNVDSNPVENQIDDTDGSWNLKEERRKGWMNVNQDILSIAPKMMDSFHGTFDKQGYDIVADTIDENSSQLVEDKKIKLLTEIKFRKQLLQLRQQAGVPSPQYNYLPDSEEKLDRYEAAGGFKLIIAKGMEKLLKHSYNVSNWKHIKSKLVRDATTKGIVALKDYYDEDDHVVKTRYVNVCNSIVQYSDSFDFNDSEYAGELTYVSIGKLREKGLKESVLKGIAKGAMGKYGNPAEQWTSYNKLDDSGWKYDFFKVMVADVEWIDIDSEYEVISKDRRGRRRVREQEWGKTNVSKGKSIRKKNVRIRYECSWVVDTDEVYDYGVASNQGREDEKTSKLSYRFILLTKTPIFKRIKPILDDLQVAWLKYQNAEVMAANAGFALNVRLLENLEVGGKKWGLGKAVKYWRETGVMPYSDYGIEGEYKGGAVSPIHSIPGGMREQLQESIEKFRHGLFMIENLTGLTPVSLGGTPEGNALKSTTEMSLKATQTVLRPIINGIMALQEDNAKSMMYRIRTVLRSNEDAVEAYSKIVKKNDIDAIIMAEDSSVEYGIDLEPRPTDDEIRDLFTWVEKAMSVGKDGTSLLDADEGLFLKEQLMNGGNLKQVRIDIAAKIKERKEEARAEAKENLRLQAERDQKFAQQKAANESKTRQEEAMIAMEKEKGMHSLAMQRENFLMNKEIKLKAMEYSHEENTGINQD